MRWKTASALGNIGSPSVVPDLLSILKNENEDRVVRRFVASALGKIGDNSTVMELIFALKNGYNELRASSASASNNARAFSA